MAFLTHTSVCSCPVQPKSKSLWRETAPADLLSLLPHSQGFTAAGSSSHFITQIKDLLFSERSAPYNGPVQVCLSTSIPGLRG